MIKLVILDIDGVITDGTVIIDSNGNEQKKLNLKDVDAIYELHRQGFLIGAITGESTSIVEYFKKRFPWDYFYSGEKNKKETIQKMEEDINISREYICYVGDGKYDIDALSYVGLGVCPANAIDRAKQASDMVLQNVGGDGCIWELLAVLESYNTPHCPHKYLLERLAEHMDLFKRLATDQTVSKIVMSCSEKIVEIFKEKGQVFLCGNGGSAADAQHIATEFVSRFYKERPGLNAEALTTNTSTLTAIGNDYSFERIFVRQLEAKARKGDMIIGITTSGQSKNVIEALRYANKQGIITVLMMGDYPTNEVEDIIDYLIKVPSTITPRIQESHIFLGHTMAEYVEHCMFIEGKED